MSRPQRQRRVSEVTIKDGDLEKAIPVPDGGRAWLLVGAAFVSQMLCAGLVQSMGGVMFFELKTYFDASDSDISWVGSSLTFSACAMSVFSGALSRHFGCRPTVIFGGFVASLSMAAGSFCQTLWQLYIAVSLTGCGCGLSLPAAISSIGFNFQVRFGVANGLQYAGVGVGIMAVPPLFQLMFDAYSWRGALLIYSGVLLNVCACGLLMRPSVAERYSLRKHATGYVAIPAKPKAVNRPSLIVISETPDGTEESKIPLAVDLQPSSINVDKAIGSGLEEAQTVDNRDKCRTSVTFDESALKIITELQSKEITPPAEKVGIVRGIQFFFRKVSKFIGINILWEHPNFACFSVAVMMFGFGYASCLTYFIPRAIQDLGVPELEAALLLTVLGANSLVARLTNGPIVDYGWISPMQFFCLSCLVCAVSSFCLPFTHSYLGSLVCAGLFGLASGVANPMLAMVSRKLVGQKIMASALGLLLLFNGVGSVVGIYTMGFVFDHFGSYDISFYIAGCDLLLLILVVFAGKALTKKAPSSKRFSTSSITREDRPVSVAASSDNAGPSSKIPDKSLTHEDPQHSRKVDACVESTV